IGLLCLAPARAQTPEVQAKLQTIHYLKKLESPGGGFFAQVPGSEGAKEGTPTLRATSSAVRALKYFGGDVPHKDGTAKFVASCFDPKTGGFADTPGGKADVFSTAVGLMAAVELGLAPEKYHAPAAKYLSDNAKTFEEIRIAVAGFESIKTPPPRRQE